jgi:2-keto-4-pentenoate hydratase
MTDTALARLLWQARSGGTVIRVEDVTVPASDEEAHAIQDAAVAMSGQPSRGFKIGSTSLEAQRILGTDRPGAAPLLAAFVHDSPATLAVSPDHAPCVEAEFAFRLAHDLPARSGTYTKAEVAASVGAVAGAIEVVGSRFAGGLKGKGRRLVTADFGANIAFVGGAWHAGFPLGQLPDHPVRMVIDGEARGAGTGSRALGDPLNVLLWLANWQSARGRGLKAGEIVSTGTCTGVDPVVPGNHVRAEFGGLGSVEIRFV